MFYTYLWLREDGTPYYVGKGKEDRAYVSGSHRLKRPKGDEQVIVQNFNSEEDAFEAEKFLIAYYGRIDLGTGCLRNLTDGGEGASGATLSEEHIKTLVDAARKRQRELYGDPILGPIARAENSARVKKYFENPEARAKTSAAVIAAMSRPEVKEANIEGQRKRFTDPRWVEKHAAGQRKRFENLEERMKASERSKKVAQDPANREKNAAAQRKLWKDSEYRAWMTEKRRTQPKRKKNYNALRKQKPTEVHVCAQG